MIVISITKRNTLINFILLFIPAIGLLVKLLYLMEYSNDLLKLIKYVCLELKRRRMVLDPRQNEVPFYLHFSPSNLSDIENSRNQK